MLDGRGDELSRSGGMRQGGKVIRQHGGGTVEGEE